jgi:hypothetical protein
VHTLVNAMRRQNGAHAQSNTLIVTESPPLPSPRQLPDVGAAAAFAGFLQLVTCRDPPASQG